MNQSREEKRGRPFSLFALHACNLLPSSSIYIVAADADADADRKWVVSFTHTHTHTHTCELKPGGLIHSFIASFTYFAWKTKLGID